MKSKHKVLIANRGEIAMRIMRACAELGVGFAAVYTSEDAESGHLDLARELKGDLVRIRSYTDPKQGIHTGRVAPEERKTA